MSHKDDAQNETTWDRNARDLVTAENYADSYGKDYSYDLADNLSQWLDPNGTQVDLTYDDADRCTARDITRGTGVGGTTAEDYVFDALDRLTEAQDNGVTVQMTWDSLSRKLTEKSGPNPMGTSGKTTSYTYDSAGNVTRIDYPDGSFYVQRTVDDVNRATLIEDGSAADNRACSLLQKINFQNRPASKLLKSCGIHVLRTPAASRYCKKSTVGLHFRKGRPREMVAHRRLHWNTHERLLGT